MENRIKEIRKEKKIGQAYMVEKLGVSRQTVISLEKGRYNPSILLAHRIAATFGLSIEQVFLFEEDE